MSSPRFLVDEHVPEELLDALRQNEPAIDLLCVGDLGAPPRRTPDPDLLIAAQAAGRVLLTMDKKTMPAHLKAHFGAGHHTAGVILMRNNFSLAVFRDELLLIWGATSTDEWIDNTRYIPET